MRLLLLLALAIGSGSACAQALQAGQQYTDARAGYRLTYPNTWYVAQSDAPATTVFYVGESPKQALAEVTLSVKPLPAGRKVPNLLAAGQLDSVWQELLRLPQSQVLRLDQHDAGTHQEVRYEYTYAAPGRRRVVGRRLWRGGREYRLEYRAAAGQQGQPLLEGRQLVQSLALTGPGPAEKAPAAAAQEGCDGNMYGIAALRFRDGQWEDDCRTIHEFGTDPSERPRIHSWVLPFQSYALAQGFDNCLYSVTKAPSDAPEYVYRYDPATRQGAYTRWQLPAQGPENVWISAATDARGDLYFITSDANLLVKVSPATDAVQVVWRADPARYAPYFPAIGFGGAGTHANFCLDDNGTLYQVYSTDGSLLQVNLATGKAAPDLIPLDGLPARGGYSDLLLQRDAAGQRRMYLAGPKAIYRVDLERRQASRVRSGTYTDLAGCNVFPPPPAPPVAAEPVAAPPAAGATWRGRVLHAATRQPLPQARLQLRGPGAPAAVPLGPDGRFAAPVAAGAAYRAQAQLAGYLSADTLFTTLAGPYVQDILLRPLAVGTTLSLSSVQFLQGQAVLLASSYPALEQLLAMLTANASMSIELRGHTDNVGDPQKNQLLSEQRADAVKAYLVRNGIAPERITTRGFGGTEPRASNSQEATRQLNRRVELRVTSMQ